MTPLIGTTAIFWFGSPSTSTLRCAPESPPVRPVAISRYKFSAIESPKMLDASVKKIVRAQVCRGGGGGPQYGGGTIIGGCIGGTGAHPCCACCAEPGGP